MKSVTTLRLFGAPDSHFVYVYLQRGAPDSLIRSDVLYRVVKDHLGIVRLIDATLVAIGACGGGVLGHGGIDWSYTTDTCVNDHSSEKASSSRPGVLQCDLISDVGESCVNNHLKIGRQMGKLVVWNQCQSFAADDLKQCRTRVLLCRGDFNGSEGASGSCGG